MTAGTGWGYPPPCSLAADTVTIAVEVAGIAGVAHVHGRRTRGTGGVAILVIHAVGNGRRCGRFHGIRCRGRRGRWFLRRGRRRRGLLLGCGSRGLFPGCGVFLRGEVHRRWEGSRSVGGLIRAVLQDPFDRVVFGRPIGQNQGVSFPIAESYIEIEAANLMRFRACELFDAHKPCGAEANMAKYLAAKASFEAANVCLQTHGGFGFAHEYDVERKFRETRLYQVAPISTNLIYSYIAEHVLGLPRSF